MSVRRKSPATSSLIMESVIEPIQIPSAVEPPKPAQAAAPVAFVPSPAEQTQTEPVPTAAPAAETATQPTAAPVPTAPPVAASAAAPQMDEKKAITTTLRKSLKARAETAVLRTAGLEGGYRSWATLVEGALERELQRLADEFNGGVPFPPNTGEFRQGRPLGS